SAKVARLVEDRAQKERYGRGEFWDVIAQNGVECDGESAYGYSREGPDVARPTNDSKQRIGSMVVVDNQRLPRQGLVLASPIEVAGVQDPRLCIDCEGCAAEDDFERVVVEVCQEHVELGHVQNPCDTADLLDVFGFYEGVAVILEQSAHRGSSTELREVEGHELTGAVSMSR